MRTCTVEATDAGGIGDKDGISAADEKAALHDADNPPDALIHPRWIDNGIEAAIENAIPVIGD
jgi:hypothetical protein